MHHPRHCKVGKLDTEFNYRTESYQLALIFRDAGISGAWYSATVNGARIRVRAIELTSGCMKRQTGAYGKARRNIYPNQPATC